MNSCHGRVKPCQLLVELNTVHVEVMSEKKIRLNNRQRVNSYKLLQHNEEPVARPPTAASVWSYHGFADVGQSALGFALRKLQTADVLQSSSVFSHLLVDDKLHAPTRERQMY